MDFYLLEVNDEDYIKLCSCHKKMVGNDEWDEEEWLQKFVGSIDSTTKVGDPYPIEWEGGKLTIIQSGFLM